MLWHLIADPAWRCTRSLCPMIRREIVSAFSWLRSMQICYALGVHRLQQSYVHPGPDPSLLGHSSERGCNRSRAALYGPCAVECRRADVRIMRRVWGARKLRYQVPAYLNRLLHPLLRADFAQRRVCTRVDRSRTAPPYHGQQVESMAEDASAFPAHHKTSRTATTWLWHCVTTVA